MAKIIMPMERPATVSVIQVEGEPTKGNAASASAMGKSAGMKSMRCFGSATPESMAVIKLVQAEGGHFPGAAKRHTGSRAKASAPGPRIAFRCAPHVRGRGFERRDSRSLMRIQAQTQQLLLQSLIRGEIRHRAGMHDAA